MGRNAHQVHLKVARNGHAALLTWREDGHAKQVRAWGAINARAPSESVPQVQMDSVEQARNVPVMDRGGQSLLLRNVAKVSESTAIGQYERYNMQRMITVTANLAAADLGTVAKQVSAAIAELGAPPPKVSVAARRSTSQSACCDRLRVVYEKRTTHVLSRN